MIKHIINFISTGAYSGYSPIAPGTAGSVVGLLIYYFLAGLSPQVYLGITIAIFLIGVKTSEISETHFKKKDPGEVVIDEIAGMLVTMFMIPLGIVYAVAGFLLFRIFDIVKPLIRWTENFKGGWGIMVDDILAGVMANLVLRVSIALLN